MYKRQDYDEILLLSDFPPDQSEPYIGWLGTRTAARIQLCPVTLSSPIDFGEIYQRAVEALDTIDRRKAHLTYHLSPGTPAMASVWILLAKTTHPARLIQSSPQAGVQEADVPFDIAAEFIPKLLQQSDQRLATLAQGLPDETAEFAAIIHRSPAMRRVIALARRVAMRSIPVLIEGESGTGKELVARAVHRLSPRRDRRWAAINCAALTDELLEAELFGHVRGAFTGAMGPRVGLLEDAHEGTLFLDEVAELSPRAQAKLLRVLQEGEIRRVGENASRRVDVRLVTATNRPLAEAARQGSYREDLVFRLAVIRLKVPPLRDRIEDIPLLAHSFWRAAAARVSTGAMLAPDALAALCRYRWPGNVRELQNVIAMLAVSGPTRGRIGARQVAAVLADRAVDGPLDPPLSLAAARGLSDRRVVASSLARHAGHCAAAARELGVSRQGLAKLIARLDVSKGA